MISFYQFCCTEVFSQTINYYYYGFLFQVQQKKIYVYILLIFNMQNNFKISLMFSAIKGNSEHSNFVFVYVQFSMWKFNNDIISNKYFNLQATKSWCKHWFWTGKSPKYLRMKNPGKAETFVIFLHRFINNIEFSLFPQKRSNK